ncbi:alpha/beta hydrolase [Nonomuraea sp. NBC_01738]|uniref:alpha/beta hydrolase n=1 Tax=Nonomuraea sp. NBC_01738 TaxID=2976003 RepID=UPI002E1516F0|nr:alpha/beta hydrolase [Nonomuraea sp. NBC_01738]
MIIRVLLALSLLVPPPARHATDTTCPVPMPERTTCGYLEVPERRDAPGTTIKVGYAVHTADASVRRPDPIVYMSGGPASSSIQLTGFLAQMFPDRDIVTVEQRGSRFSQPRLGCPETVKAMLDRLRGVTSDAGAAAVACRERLRQQGADLLGYNTREIAADVVALRGKLGYPSWNLFGVSYSTRVMVDVATADPQGVRAIVLDSFLPEAVSWYGDADRNLAGTVAALGVGDRFERMVRRLNEHPALVPTTDPLLGTRFTARLTGNDVATIMAEALHDASVLAVAPALIDALADGHDELLRPLADAVGDGLTSHEFGLYHAVQCQDEAIFPGTSRLFTVNTDKAVCAAWKLPVTQPTKDLRGSTPAGTPPVLVIGGQFDPTTPPRTAGLAAAKLPGATFAEFSGMGHAVFLASACARRTIAAFVALPSGWAPPCPSAAAPPRSASCTSRARRTRSRSPRGWPRRGCCSSSPRSSSSSAGRSGACP